MEVTADIEIAKSKKEVWTTITDIKNCANYISGIIDIQLLTQPEEGLVGLKWKETREFFGKEASEIMWITDSVETEYYCTRAESHGSIYTTKLSLGEFEGKTTLTRLFQNSVIFGRASGVFLTTIGKSLWHKELSKNSSDI